MQDYERASMLEQQRETNRLLGELVKQGTPIRSVAELQQLMTPAEFETAKRLRVEDASLGELVETVSEARGFANVGEMMAHDQRQKERKSRPNTKTLEQLAGVKPP